MMEPWQFALMMGGSVFVSAAITVVVLCLVLPRVITKLCIAIQRGEMHKYRRLMQEHEEKLKGLEKLEW